jgi:proteasome lid subunit RPN8/RPN11
MIPIQNSIREQFIELATRSPDREIGAYLHQGELHLLENVSPEDDQFEADLEGSHRIISYLSKGEEVVLLHSHVNGNPDFSVQDVVMSRANQLPVYLYHLKSGMERYYDPNSITPYEGRTWSYTTSNCYTLVQDFYRKEYRVKLKDFYLDRPEEFNEPGFNKFISNIQAQGFIQLKEGDELKQGDLILFSLRGIHPNHIGVMFDVEANKFLHQLVDRFSRLSSYCRDYRSLTHSRWRHQSLL